MRTTTELFWLTLAGAVPMAVAMAAVGGQGAPADDAAAIRAARADSNAAIARHDTAGIARHWLPDVSIVTSTGTHGDGQAVNASRMAAQFERRPDTIYVRTPSSIDVFAAWNVASERGEWTGRWTEPDGVVNIAGTYLAQWRKAQGVWRIQAEVFVPTTCSGASYCASHP
ncbi:MAG: nuclear transport factor 2 family protein [Acidobacteria bacterium]|nr:nuclear transport factor 2 family protein [Acidobacteriota bacterium]